ncbi:MAG TPA: hypothetical protein VGV64_06325, partial [Thermoplasmata archaeon]|nr:hypothetical protein [Thermoplasmata archaeon]
MRTLTEAEARTISVLLGSATAPERERLRRSQLPRSTYHAARRRAYEEGWLRDRYVPEPDRFGRPWAVVTVARPFADRVTELSDAWSAETGTVLQFGGTGAMGAVVLFGERKKAERFVERLQEKEIASTSLSVVADLRGPAIPVYFDFEGIWSHLSGTDGTIGYPRGLGGSGPTAESDR